jgi:VanZ family protein
MDTDPAAGRVGTCLTAMMILVFGRILLIVVILIIYGSLYPFDFHARQLSAAPLSILFHSWPSSLDRFLLKDVVLNVLIYLPVGFFGSLMFGRGRSRLLSAAVAICLGLVLSTCMEILQLYDDSRECSLLDIVSNASGSVLGAALSFIYGRRVARVLADSQTQAALRPSGALLLLCCWIGYQIFPLIPQLSRTQLSLKISALLHPASFSAIQAIGALADWVMVARLLEGVGGAKALPWMMLLVPARLFVAGRSFTWPEAIGAVCAWLLWNRMICLYEKRTVLLAWLAAAMLLLRGLAPYHWQSTPTPFSWMPFAGFLAAEQGLAGIVFFDKTFLYGTTLWLFREGGYPDLISIPGVAMLLAIIEALQTHLPGRTPESTDPVYVLVLALVLRLLDSADRQVRVTAPRRQ